MKRNLCFLSLICTAVILLSGCFLYDHAVGDNISPFIDPLSNGSDGFLPDSHADKVIILDILPEPLLVIEQGEEEEDDGIIILDENRIRQMKPPIIEVSENKQINYYYEGDTFTFQIPFLWRTTMVVDVITEQEEPYNIVYYVFYYVPGDQHFEPPYMAEVMTLRVAPYGYYLKHGHGTNGYSANGSVNALDEYVYTYYAPGEDQKLSSDFPKLEDYGTIIKVLTNNWNFKVIKGN